jgi:hypothetical protein
LGYGSKLMNVLIESVKIAHMVGQLAIPPALFAVLVAAMVRAVTVLCRTSGLRVGVRGMMVAVALIGSWLGTARWWVDHNFATVYASGYSESGFRRVRIGMTPEEVGSVLGQPLRRDSTSPNWSPCENWMYSDPPHGLGEDYWRKWVIFRDGKVCYVDDSYYVD